MATMTEVERLRLELDAERAVSASLREQLARLSGAVRASREPREYTPPRYDEVFFEGAAAAEAEVRAGSDMAELARWLLGACASPTATQPGPPARTIEQAAEALQAEVQRSYSDAFVGIGAGDLHVYVKARRPREFVIDGFLGYPVKWHFGVDPKPAEVSRG